ncbi:MAG TPA: ABC transporter permease subunit [Planctomycetes bacterium]|nr:ABC transporter permease subunit [Planctomycetota bacterium]
MSVLGPGRSTGDRIFFGTLIGLGIAYILMVLGMLVADASFTPPAAMAAALAKPEIRHAFGLSFTTATVTAILSVWFGVPIGYLMARRNFPGKSLVDAILDVPIVLPPMVIGLSLLILFQTGLGRQLESGFAALFGVGITYEVPSIILAQFAVSCAFAIRTLRVTFDQLDPRCEDVARTLGCSSRQAFWHVVLPSAWKGVLSAGLLAWARALGEFGPVLVFSGATRMKTEVLPSTVFLELSVGDLEAAVAVSLILVAAAVGCLLLGRLLGLKVGR